MAPDIDWNTHKTSYLSLVEQLRVSAEKYVLFSQDLGNVDQNIIS